MCRLDHLGGLIYNFQLKNSGLCAIMDHKGKHNSKDTPIHRMAAMGGC